MTDKFSKEIRSYIMSRIRSKNTKPEIIVRKFLFSKGFRFRIHAKYLPGKPDIVLKKYKTVIFVNGCFWHGHYRCKHSILPKTRYEYWFYKIHYNKLKDKKNKLKLAKMGWNVIIIWECQLKNNRVQKNI
jgi:DNA mismatch endonuclease, patch repair protein